MAALYPTDGQFSPLPPAECTRRAADNEKGRDSVLESRPCQNVSSALVPYISRV